MHQQLVNHLSCWGSRAIAPLSWASVQPHVPAPAAENPASMWCLLIVNWCFLQTPPVRTGNATRTAPWIPMTFPHSPPSKPSVIYGANRWSLLGLSSRFHSQKFTFLAQVVFWNTNIRAIYQPLLYLLNTSNTVAVEIITARCIPL